MSSSSSSETNVPASLSAVGRGKATDAVKILKEEEDPVTAEEEEDQEDETSGLALGPKMEAATALDDNDNNGKEHSLSAADYIKLINIKTGKIMALLLVVAFGIYHGLLHLSYGVTPCKGLIVDGMYKGDFWQPWGCMMHKYSQA